MFTDVKDKHTLKTILNMATQDIKFNRLLFGKKTHFRDVQKIILLCKIVYERGR